MTPKKYQIRSKTQKNLIQKAFNARTIDAPANPKSAKCVKHEKRNNNVKPRKVALSSGGAELVDCSHETMQDKKKGATGKSFSKIYDNKNNSCDESAQELGDNLILMLSKMCIVHLSEKKTPKVGFTKDDLKSFLASSTIKSVNLAVNSTAELFQRLIDATLNLKELTLAELIDHYHLAILMQSYKPLETDCMGYRSELFDAVAKLCIDLPPDCIKLIGTVLCDIFVFGTGMERMDKVVQMQKALAILIIKDDFSCQIAMSILLATFAKVLGMPRKNTNTDIISEVCEMVKLVDWMQMSIAGNVADIFALVRSYSLIINSPHNRKAHADCATGMSSEIQEYFLHVVRAVRCSPNFSNFEMMVVETLTIWTML